MQSFRDFLITDRTAADVERVKALAALFDHYTGRFQGTPAQYQELMDGPKGAYTWVDLNRVTRGYAYVSTRLAADGYRLEPEICPAYLVAVGTAPAGANFSGGGIFYQGETATVRAVNDAYNEFDEWQEDGRTVSRDIEYSFTVDRDRRLLAVFEPLDDGKLGVVGRGLIGSARIGRRGA